MCWICIECHVSLIAFCRVWDQSLATPWKSDEWHHHWDFSDWCDAFLLFWWKVSKQIYIGTAILLRPGIILGGTLQHDCPTSRSIGYFLEPIVRLAPFAKKPMHLTLKGITTDEHDLSVRSLIIALWYLSKCLQYQADILRTVTLPHLQLFGISDGLELRVITQCRWSTTRSLHVLKDKKTRFPSWWRWGSPIPLSHRQTSQDP